MKDMINTIKSKDFFSFSVGSSEEQVLAAEEALGLNFTDEYREYLSAFGTASFDGHELTGISKTSRLNVVDVTKEERQKYSDIPADWYVLEQLHIDDVSIWQARSGEIYQLMPGAKALKICDSFSEYINS